MTMSAGNVPGAHIPVGGRELPEAAAVEKVPRNITKLWIEPAVDERIVAERRYREPVEELIRERGVTAFLKDRHNEEIHNTDQCYRSPAQHERQQ